MSSKYVSTPPRRVYVPKTITVETKTKDGKVAFEEKRVIDNQIVTRLWDNPVLRKAYEDAKEREYKQAEIDKAYVQDANYRRKNAKSA